MEPAASITVVGRANFRRLLIFLCANLALVVACLAQMVAAPVEFTTVLLLVVSGLTLPILFSLLRNPMQMTVADGYFSIRRRRQPRRWPVQDLIGLEHDADTVRLTFRSVAHIEPSWLRAKLEKQFTRHGHHLQLPGLFSLAQINQVRAALGWEPLPDKRPGSLAEFHCQLRSLTPRVFVTPALVGVNVIIYAALALCCQSHWRPTAIELVN